MSNMSYCRFTNTDNDLSDCETALETLYTTDTEDGEEPLSTSELEAAVSLLVRCAEIIEQFCESAGIDVEQFTSALHRADVIERHLTKCNDDLCASRDDFDCRR